MRKGEKKNGFSISDYKHLSQDTPLDIWISEFLFRNAYFRKECELAAQLLLRRTSKYHSFCIQGPRNEDVQLLLAGAELPPLPRPQEVFDAIENKYKILLPRLAIFDNPELIFQQSKRRKLRVSLLPGVKAMRVLRSDDVESSHGLQEAWGQSNDPVEQRFYLNHCSAKVWNAHMPDSLCEFFAEKEDSMWKVAGDSLLLSINMNRTVPELKNELNRVLKIHKKRRKSSLQPTMLNAWKLYLIAYDIKQSARSGLSYQRIYDEYLTPLLQDNTIPVDVSDRLADRKTFAGYYKKALVLINMGYKKYL